MLTRNKKLVLIGLACFISTTSFADSICMVNVSVSSKVATEGGAIFNIQSNSDPVKTYSSDGPVVYSPKDIKVPCDTAYSISATPVNQSILKTTLAGKYSYRGNPVYIPVNGSLSVTYPNDFPDAPKK